MEIYDRAILLLADTTQDHLELRFYNCHPFAYKKKKESGIYTSYNGPYKYTELGKRFYSSLQCVLKRVLWIEPDFIRLEIQICHGKPVIAGIALKGAPSIPLEHYFGLSVSHIFDRTWIYNVVYPELGCLVALARLFTVEINKRQKI